MPSAMAARIRGPCIRRITGPRTPAAPTIRVDGHDVATQIRSAAVTDAVSHVSVVPQVRRRLQQAR